MVATVGPTKMLASLTNEHTHSNFALIPSKSITCNALYCVDSHDILLTPSSLIHSAKHVMISSMNEC